MASLRHVWQVLHSRLLYEEARRWAWTRLPGGAWVGLRQGEEGREVRICREGSFKTADGPDAWKLEVRTFLREFGVEGWEEAESPPREDAQVATFREPRRLL